MSETLQAAVEAIQMQFDAEEVEFRGETTLILKPELVVAAARVLKEQFQFEFLIDATAVDYWPESEPRFKVVYQLYDIQQNQLLRLQVLLNGIAPEMDTMEVVYANANWKEREIFDMFGINFKGHSDLRRILMPADWEGHPLRKDYPLGYEEVQFTFNFDEIDLRKPKPKGDL
jgi:NADH-quinone oxidoreductase subunit C